MKKRKPDKSPRRKNNEEAKRLQAIYARSRREFSAADLQKFTVNEPGVPLKTVVAEMQRIQNGRKRKKA
jgi:hypothetical protein